MEKVAGIIVDSDPNKRMQLRQVCMEVHSMAQLETVSTLDKALEVLAEDPEHNLNVVFISHRLDRKLIDQFLSSAKTTTRGQDSAYVITLPGKDQQGAGVAKALMEGFDSCLLEPFSVNSVKETAKLAIVIKKERERAREVAMVNLLMRDYLNLIDLLSKRFVRKQEGGPDVIKYKEVKKTLSEFSEKAKNMLKTFLPAELAKREPPTLTLDQEKATVRSAKQRAQIRILEKLRAQGVAAPELEQTNTNTDALWEATEEYNAFVIRLKQPLYDKPTCLALVSFFENIAKDQKKEIALDFTGTAFISTFALAAIYNSNNHLKAVGKKLQLRNSQGFVKDVFDTLDFESLL